MIWSIVLLEAAIRTWVQCDDKAKNTVSRSAGRLLYLNAAEALMGPKGAKEMKEKQSGCSL